MKKVEKGSQTAQRTGCSGWIFGIGNLLIRISEKPHKTVNQPVIVETTPPHRAITGADLEYTHPELIPSRGYYDPKEVAKRAEQQKRQHRTYTGTDGRGG